MYELFRTPEFEEWFGQQPQKSQLQVDDRLIRIMTDEHFGNCKHLTDFIWELKWVNGRRIYYAYLAEYNILLLLGGNKNGQDKDIKQAKKILEKYTETRS